MKSYSDWASEISGALGRVSDDMLEWVAALCRRASMVLTAGNGGSASLASHAAQALMKPDYAAGGGIRAVCVTDGVPTLTAHANDGGWGKAMLEAARPFLVLQPVLFLFSSSGRSANVVELASAAKQHFCEVVAFTGAAGGSGGGPLRELATVSLHVESDDYEVIEPAHDALLHRVQYHVRRLGGS